MTTGPKKRRRRSREGKMPLVAHLREARNRALWALAGILVAAVVGWFLYPQVIAAMSDPITNLPGDGRSAALNFSAVATSFDMKIKVSLFTGVILSAPWWLFQVWAFITPALTRRERWISVGFIFSATPLFLAGTLLAWSVLPTAVRFLTEFTPESGVNFIDAQMYLSFVMRLLLGFGLAFTLPVVMVGMSLAGLVRARTWLNGWRWAVVGIFAFSAMATPTSDAVTMFALAIPMLVLYFAAVGVAALIDRRRDRRLARELQEV